MSDNGTEDDEVTEIFPVAQAKPREIIDLTVYDSDNEIFSFDVKPTQLTYDTDSHQIDCGQHISEGKAPDSNIGSRRKNDTLNSRLTNKRKRVRDKSPRNAPQNLLLLKEIYRNICPPSEYKPLYPDDRGKIDEPLEIYKDVTLDIEEPHNGEAKCAPPKRTSLVSRFVCNDIYATDSSSTSSSPHDSKCKEHSLNSLHFSDLAEDMYELADGDLVAPWINSNEDEAPELMDVPEPCFFREVLDSMSQTVESKLAPFQTDIPNHVSADLLSSTNIESQLLSKYRSVFVPVNWLGIQHIEPLHIETLSTLPLSLKPKARPVNPALYANAKLEFDDRLKGYFYIESVSPYPSCLVIARKKTPPYIRICGDYRVINQHIRSTCANSQCFE